MQHTIENTESGNVSVNKKGVGVIAKFETFDEAVEFMIDCGLCEVEEFTTATVKTTVINIEYAEMGLIQFVNSQHIESAEINKKEKRALEKIKYEQLIKTYTPHPGKYRVTDVFGHNNIYTQCPIISKKNYLETNYAKYVLSCTGETCSDVGRTVYAYQIIKPLATVRGYYDRLANLKPCKPYKKWQIEYQSVTIYHDADATLEEVKELAKIEFIKEYGF